MAYENIRFRRQNITVVDNYFVSIDEDLDVLLLKSGDGTVVFSYPLDSTISNTVISLEYDGHNFWSMEQVSADQLSIKRWIINNYVLTLTSTFNFIPSVTHKYSSEAFTIEHYHTTFSDYEAAGSSVLSIHDGSKLSSGIVLVLGPNNSGQIEEVTALSATSGSVTINGTTQYNHEDGTPISFYKNIWIFNNYSGVDDSTGALYKVSAYTGSVIHYYPGGAFKDIKACTFFNIPRYVFDKSVPKGTIDPVYDSICYIKGTNTLCLNPDDLNNSYGSMTMDNIEEDQATVIDVYDLAIEGTNVYRLQSKATYYGTTHTFGSTYNYQLSTFNSFITSISLNADPAILPANSGGSSSTAQITAIVKDQFNLPVPSKMVYFSEDDPDGTIAPENTNTNANGVASTIYTAGFTARETRLTATAQQS